MPPIKKKPKKPNTKKKSSSSSKKTSSTKSNKPASVFSKVAAWRNKMNNLSPAQKTKIRMAAIGAVGAVQLGLGAAFFIRARMFYKETLELQDDIAKLNSDLLSGKLKDKEEVLGGFDKLIKKMEIIVKRYRLVMLVTGKTEPFGNLLSAIKQQRSMLENHFNAREAMIKDTLNENLNEIKKLVDPEDAPKFSNEMIPSEIKKFKIKYHPDNVLRRFGSLSEEQKQKKMLDYTKISQFLNQRSN